MTPPADSCSLSSLYAIQHGGSMTKHGSLMNSLEKIKGTHYRKHLTYLKEGATMRLMIPTR